MSEEEAEEQVGVLPIGRSTGVIRRLSYHEERHDLEQLQLKSTSGTLAVVNAKDNDDDRALPLWDTGESGDSAFEPAFVGANAVWSKLLEATSYRDHCGHPPCGKVNVPVIRSFSAAGLDYSRKTRPRNVANYFRGGHTSLSLATTTFPAPSVAACLTGRGSIYMQTGRTLEKRCHEFRGLQLLRGRTSPRFLAY